MQIRCSRCNIGVRKNGLTKRGTQRYKCYLCNKTFIIDRVGSVYTPEWKMELCRGLRKLSYTIRQIAMISGLAKKTVVKAINMLDISCNCGRGINHKGSCKFRRSNYLRAAGVAGSKSKL